MDTKGQDPLVIIKLYGIRSEALMREARAWFFSEFVPQSGKDIVALMLRFDSAVLVFDDFSGALEVDTSCYLIALDHSPSGNTLCVIGSAAFFENMSATFRPTLVCVAGLLGSEVGAHRLGAFSRL